MQQKSSLVHTILGAGGAISNHLASTLTEYTTQIRLVSRHPKKVNATDELFPADLLNAKEMEQAIEGSEVVYATVGFPYNAKVWQKCWPVFMTNLIAACKKHNVKLVFFDNIYMYDKNYLNGMDESTPIHPSSKKGEVRAAIYNQLLHAIENKELTATIARSADFYGPGEQRNSVITETVITPFLQGKTASWLGNANFKHSFTYTPDAAKAMAILGNSPKGFDQPVWHIPTASPALTGKEWIEKIAHELDVKPNYRNVSRLMLKLIGLFVPILSETAEMYYQNNRDYVFDSSAFETAFDFTPTAYDEGIKATIQSIKNKA